MPTIAVSGMGCEGCEDIVENAVSEVRGVESVSVNHESGEMEYTGEADEDGIAEAIEFAGYELATED